MRIAIKHGEQYYLAAVSQRWAIAHDNGALISIGLTVGEDLTERAFKGLMYRGQLHEISHDVWNHLGCQSSCVRRGGVRCAW